MDTLKLTVDRQTAIHLQILSERHKPAAHRRIYAILLPTGAIEDQASPLVTRLRYKTTLWLFHVMKFGST